MEVNKIFRTENGDYPPATEGVFISHGGEPYVGYFLPDFNEDVQQGGVFHLSNGDWLEVRSDEIDYWMYV